MTMSDEILFKLVDYLRLLRRNNKAEFLNNTIAGYYHLKCFISVLNISWCMRVRQFEIQAKIGNNLRMSYSTKLDKDLHQVQGGYEKISKIISKIFFELWDHNRKVKWDVLTQEEKISEHITLVFKLAEGDFREKCRNSKKAVDLSTKKPIINIFTGSMVTHLIFSNHLNLTTNFTREYYFNAELWITRINNLLNTQTNGIDKVMTKFVCLNIDIWNLQIKLIQRKYYEMY